MTIFVLRSNDFFQEWYQETNNRFFSLLHHSPDCTSLASLVWGGNDSDFITAA